MQTEESVSLLAFFRRGPLQQVGDALERPEDPAVVVRSRSIRLVPLCLGERSFDVDELGPSLRDVSLGPLQRIVRVVLVVERPLQPGLDDLDTATCGWVAWFNIERIHGELDDATPADVETAYHAAKFEANAA